LADEMDLRLVDLQAGYGNLDILHGVDLSVSAGEFVSLMGPNGAGKSTLLKTIYGMTTIKSGSILWGGTELAGMKPRDVLGQGISYVPQGRCNFPQMTVEENLEMAAYTIPGGSSDEEKDRIFDLFPVLKSRRGTMAGNMSGGEQQLLEMAMAMLQRPRGLLVDEPSVGLSPAAIGLVFDELCRIHESGLTILLVEQNTKKAMEYSKRAVVLRLGKVIWDSPPGDLSHDDLGELFMTGEASALQPHSE